VDAALDDDFDVPRALEALDQASVRVLSGHARAGEEATVRAALQTFGFAFADAEGPATGVF
jgi:hypothetical protein